MTVFRLAPDCFFVSGTVIAAGTSVFAAGTPARVKFGIHRLLLKKFTILKKLYFSKRNE